MVHHCNIKDKLSKSKVTHGARGSSESFSPFSMDPWYVGSWAIGARILFFRVRILNIFGFWGLWQNEKGIWTIIFRSMVRGATDSYCNVDMLTTGLNFGCMFSCVFVIWHGLSYLRWCQKHAKCIRIASFNRYCNVYIGTWRSYGDSVCTIQFFFDVLAILFNLQYPPGKKKIHNRHLRECFLFWASRVTKNEMSMVMFAPWMFI